MAKEEYIDLVIFDEPFHIEQVQRILFSANIEFRLSTGYSLEPDSKNGLATVSKLQVLKKDYDFAKKKLKVQGFYIDPNEPAPRWYNALEYQTSKLKPLARFDLRQRLMILFGIIVLSVCLPVYLLTHEKRRVDINDALIQNNWQHKYSIIHKNIDYKKTDSAVENRGEIYSFNDYGELFIKLMSDTAFKGSWTMENENHIRIEGKNDTLDGIYFVSLTGDTSLYLKSENRTISLLKIKKDE